MPVEEKKVEVKLYCVEKTYDKDKYLSYYVDLGDGVPLPVKPSDSTAKTYIDKYYRDNNLVK